MKAKTAEAFAGVIVDAIAKVIAGPKVGGRLAALEARVAAVEAKPHVKFCGVWDREKTYTPGDACTHAGGLWICRTETTGQPNRDFVGWTLAVKSRSIA